jgi:hypothetical protein
VRAPRRSWACPSRANGGHVSRAPGASRQTILLCELAKRGPPGRQPQGQALAAIKPPSAAAAAPRRALGASPPGPVRTPQTTLLNFGPAHAASYNELVEGIRRNLLLADWCDDEHKEVRRAAPARAGPGRERAPRRTRPAWRAARALSCNSGPCRPAAWACLFAWLFDSVHLQVTKARTSSRPRSPQSLLNNRQSKWAKEVLRNVRLSCNVAGVLNLVVKVPRGGRVRHQDGGCFVACALPCAGPRGRP